MIAIYVLKRRGTEDGMLTIGGIPVWQDSEEHMQELISELVTIVPNITTDAFEVVKLVEEI